MKIEFIKSLWDAYLFRVTGEQIWFLIVEENKVKWFMENLWAYLV